MKKTVLQINLTACPLIILGHQNFANNRIYKTVKITHSHG